jgi:hypothetical protein
MTHHASTARRRRSTPPATGRAPSDGTIYAGFALIGFFVVLLAFPLFEGNWRVPLVAYVALVAILVNLYAWRAYRSRHLARWQKSLARLPLRAAGYGTRSGKPLEAAHGQPEARRAIAISIAVSIVVVAGLAWALIPPLRDALL